MIRNVWISVRRIYILLDISDCDHLPLALGLGIPFAFLLLIVVYFMFTKLKHKGHAVDEVRISKEIMRGGEGGGVISSKWYSRDLSCRPPSCADQTWES